ncbi:response regulator [Saccharibacillus sp. CPCC 101409]|uniref:helix-turn-helix domain-containing protein n=1 Tax=Saccharibacillus sp. CPCC 101409 TaxID=3058041 RepID=UPI0026713B21|nr:helix-turn-helix domain-containing protein [Saccharibacillus sp. CPCC 101409]MDO3411054.1 response regulator [Saccharibacillus sp. CPCC 101409]
MLNVLVVDDDKLVRQGLISAMPWSAFGLRVAGEARNGEKALEFLETHEVDLLLTDLAMPVMSGLELMRIVRGRYPRVFIVVLTLHQDFSYIQEALRLGAIDYIAKVQLEEERFEEVLERICSRIASERAKEAAPFAGAAQSDAGYALLGGAEAQALAEAASAEGCPPDFAAAAGLPVWLAAAPPEEERLAAALSRLVLGGRSVSLLRLDGLRGRSAAEISARLRAYAEGEWYYARRPGERFYALDLGAAEAPEGAAARGAAGSAAPGGSGTAGGEAGSRGGGPPRGEPGAAAAGAGGAAGPADTPGSPAAAERPLDDLRRRGAELEWVHDAAAFDAFLAELAARRLPPPLLRGELLDWTHTWNRIYEAASGERLEPPEPGGSWFEAERGLRAMRERLAAALGAQPFSPEVRASVLRAAALVRERLSDPLQAGQIAREVNMSRSYFSQCFRDMIGRTFNDYVRQQRIERACELLAETRRTIQWVAERTGYADEKYFSRIFREQTGLLPSEYRQRLLSKGTNVR